MIKTQQHRPKIQPLIMGHQTAALATLQVSLLEAQKHMSLEALMCWPLLKLIVPFMVLPQRTEVGP